MLAEVNKMVLRLVLSVAIGCGLAIAAEQPFFSVPLKEPPITLRQGEERALLNSLKPWSQSQKLQLEAMHSPMRDFKLPPTARVGIQPDVPKICSIPLKEYKPPANREYFIRDFKLPAQPRDHMAIAPPRPACGEERARLK